MQKEQIIKVIKELKENSPKRNFKQTIDIIINLKQIDIKKQDQKIDTFLTLNQTKGKPIKTCIFLDKQLEPKAKDKFTKIIIKEEFSKWTDKKELKKLAKSYDFFIAQANLMVQIAGTFGKYLGPLGKMPNPKAGCVVTMDSDLDFLADKLQKTIRLITKNEPILKASVGDQEMPDEQIADNILNIYNHITNNLPQHELNIKSVLIKFSMSPPKFIIGGKKQEK